jgi:hypothetical protein
MSRLFAASLLSCFALLACGSSFGADKPQVQDTSLAAALEKEDREFFKAAFDNCDVDRIAATITADFEFYHDKAGLIANSKDKFVEWNRRICERRKTGESSSMRRELVPGSLHAYPLSNYGAIQTGEHRFYKLVPGKPDVLTEVAKFTTVWKNENGHWLMARVLSYDHQQME